MRVNNQLGFSLSRLQKANPSWLSLACGWCWQGLAQGWDMREATNTAEKQQRVLQMGRKRENRERERQVRTRGKMHSVTQCWWLTGLPPARLPGTDGKGFPHIPQRRLLAMVLHSCSAALCSSSSAACLGPEIPVHTSGTSVDAFPTLGRAPLQPISFVGHKELPDEEGEWLCSLMNPIFPRLTLLQNSEPVRQSILHQVEQLRS